MEDIMGKYLVTWIVAYADAENGPDFDSFAQEEVVVDADSALEAEVIVHEEYGVRRSLMTVRCVA